MRGVSRAVEQKIREDERRRIADVIEDAANVPDADADPERVDVMRGLARALRTDTEALLILGLEAILEEIRAEEAAKQ